MSSPPRRADHPGGDQPDQAQTAGGTENPGQAEEETPGPHGGEVSAPALPWVVFDFFFF